MPYENEQYSSQDPLILLLLAEDEIAEAEATISYEMAGISVTRGEWRDE